MMTITFPLPRRMKSAHALIILKKEHHPIACRLPVRRMHPVKGGGPIVTFSALQPGCGRGAKRPPRTLAAKAWCPAYWVSVRVSGRVIFCHSDTWRELSAHLNWRTNSSRWFCTTRYSVTRSPFLSSRTEPTPSPVA